MYGKFTYPFCYTPHPEIVKASQELIRKIDSDCSLRPLFSEGKMLGALICREPSSGEEIILYAFSGLAGGRIRVDGFVEPIFDWADAEGYFRKEESAITSLNHALEADLSPEEASSLREERRRRSEALQKWLFSVCRVKNFLGEEATIEDIFASLGITAPGGTGDCAAPRLLNAAARRGLQPLAMGEFWYGKSPSSELRIQGRFYPSCKGKCGPLLPWMMRGLDVEDNPLEIQGDVSYSLEYEDESLIVVNKPSGLLCAPGKNGTESLEELLAGRYGPVFSCHRLDMDTSGLMVYARSEQIERALRGAFESRTVRKEYQALLLTQGTRDLEDGSEGTIDLPLSPDWDDRPRQMVDRSNGKRAISSYRVLFHNSDGSIGVLLRPHTGRTHQLRVHCAHPDGLGRPICGDRLYGGRTGAYTDTRLCLHSSSLSFVHPLTGNTMRFRSEAPFMKMK